MKEFVEKYNLSKTPRRSLIGSMHGEKMLFATPLLKWYLDKGLKITRVYECIEYQPVRCFRSFVQKVCDARRLGDTDPDKSIIADTMKLIGNSAYGSMIMDKTKHTEFILTDNHEKAMNHVNNPLYRKIKELSENAFEIELAKTKIIIDLPIVLGYFILQLAKKHMLAFYYDFVDKYIPRNCFEYCQKDTDSAYMALSGPNLESCVPNHLKAEFLKEKHNWFPRDDTPEHAAYDKRVCGLFKLEYEGTRMVSLCAKSYCVHNDKRDHSKFSCKGVSKKQFDKPTDIYKQVLDTGISYTGKNVGFRKNKHVLHTYEQEKIAFSYFYGKRKVLSDGISTAPLDI